MAVEKCEVQSFHHEAYHKGRYFVGCNYYGMIVDTKRCEKCKIKKHFEKDEKVNEEI